MTTEFWKAAFDHQIIESLIWSLPPNYLKGLLLLNVLLLNLVKLMEGEISQSSGTDQ
jgi:hypothetical protein